MYSQARKLFERTVIGDSIPALIRWGKRVSPAVIGKIRRDEFVEIVRYAAKHQKFFARKLRQGGIDPKRVRCPEDLGDIFTTPEDLRTLPSTARYFHSGCVVIRHFRPVLLKVGSFLQTPTPYTSETGDCDQHPYAPLSRLLVPRSA